MNSKFSSLKERKNRYLAVRLLLILIKGRCFVSSKICAAIIEELVLPLSIPIETLYPDNS